MTATQKEIKKNTEKNINNMSSLSIIWFLVRRHDRFLLILALVLSWTAFIVHDLPPAVHNLVK